MDSIGFIGDIHKHPKNLEHALVVLKEKGITQGIANGDLGDREEDIAYVLEQLGKSGITWVVQPGSHEWVTHFECVFNELELTYGNLRNAFFQRRIEKPDYHLVFLPGSDFCSNGQYFLRAIESGEEGHYLQTPQGMQKIMPNQLPEIMGTPQAKAALCYITNIYSLRKHVVEPEKTILVCHVPPFFSNLAIGVDMAHYGEVTETFVDARKAMPITKGSIFPLPYARVFAAAGAPLAIKKENRGNKKLQQLVQELGIKKGVFNHFHESSHRAHDSACSPVAEGTFTDNLYWMSGWLDYGHFGILHIDKNNVAYENLSVRGKDGQTGGAG